MWQNGSRKLSLWLPILFTICLLSSESHAEKLKCPEVKTLFDVPAATTCRELAKLLRSDRVCSGFKTIDTKCCGLLQTALGKHCNCWPGFRKPVLAAFQRMHDSCLEFQAGPPTQTCKHSSYQTHFLAHSICKLCQVSRLYPA